MRGTLASVLAVGSVTYIALIPVSAYRYLSAKRRAEADAKEPAEEQHKSESAAAKPTDAANNNTRSTRESSKS